MKLKKILEISAHFASKQALEKNEKAGGKLNIIKKIIMSSETLNTAGAFSQAKDLKK